MIRNAWLIVSVAALFGVQGPLCVFACVEQGNAAAPVAAADHPSHENAPCHGSQPVAPDAPGSSKHECRCDLLQLVRSNVDADKVVDTIKAPARPLAIAAIQLPRQAPPAARLRDRHRRLPPPDILLLKSSLLI